MSVQDSCILNQLRSNLEKSHPHDLHILYNAKLVKKHPSELQRRNPERAGDMALVYIRLKPEDAGGETLGGDIADYLVSWVETTLRKIIRQEDIIVCKDSTEYVLILIGADTTQATNVIIHRIQRNLHRKIAVLIGRERILFSSQCMIMPYDRSATPLENIISVTHEATDTSRGPTLMMPAGVPIMQD